MGFCFNTGVAALAAGFVLEAATSVEPVRRITSEVRADARSGRLVRSVVVSPRTGSPRQSAKPGDLSVEVNEAIQQIAERHELEPLLVDSVIRVESNYNPYAISPKGAEGLMQLIPSTARRFGVSHPFSPVENIEGGVRYLKYLLQLYGDNYPLALAAYNAGEAAVARYRGIPPYPETRNYVYQVGKKLGAARAAAERTKAKAAQPDTNIAGDQHPPIEKAVDAEGREYYRTR
jgi:soluble lytic murein transglycosylase-like protein